MYRIFMLNTPATTRKEAQFLKKPTKSTKSTEWIAVVLLIFSLGAVTGCATTSSQPSINDPFEKANRAIFKLNLETDRLIWRPLAKGYTQVVPSPMRTGVSNFFSNLWQPMTVVNDVLQGKLSYAARDTSRFLINTTFGIFGIFDVASRFKLPEHREDFGQTLAVWNIPPGPYLVLPFFGASTLRDTGGLIPQFAYADAVSYIDSPEAYYTGVLRLIDARMKLLGADELLDLQPDQYLFIRENYYQQRWRLLHDGKPPVIESDSDDELIDQLLDEG